eukprot:g8820.t1
MLRSFVLKSGFGAGLVAASQASRSADASVRQISPTSVVRATHEKLDSSPSTEETWLDVSMNEGGTLIFTPTEVNDVVEEIQNLNLDDTADRAIDEQNTHNPRTTVNEVLRASQMMLEDPHVQNACMGAIANNPQLRELFENMTETTLTPDVPPMIEAHPISRPRQIENNPMKTLVEDLAHQFGCLLSNAVHAMSEVGKILGKVGKALWENVKDPMGEMRKVIEDSEKSDVAKVSGLVLRFATFIMVVLIAKRVVFK